jgi:hypothetical protein
VTRRILTAALAAAILLVAAATASAHQIASNNSVAVQVHVDPNDEPIAGVPTTVWVVRVRPVKPLRATFAWTTCRCRLKVFDSSGTVILDTAVKTPRTPITFPEAKAYGITFTGRVKRLGTQKVLWRTFKVTYAIRAFAEAPTP